MRQYREQWVQWWMLLIITMGWHGGAASAEIDRFEPMDVFDLEYANYPQVSPDGTRVLYIRRSFDVMRDASRASLWLVDLKTDEHKPLLADFGSYGWPTWNHKGTKVAYTTANRRRHQIRMLDLEYGRSALIVDLPTAPGWLAFSPDDETLAFTRSVVAETEAPLYKAPKRPKGAKWAASARVIESVRYQFDGRGIVAPSYAHVFVVPAEGGTSTQLTVGDFQNNGPLIWQPDGHDLIFSSNRDPNWALQTFESDLYSVAVGSRALTQLTDFSGREYAPELSQDGTQLLYLTQSSQRATYRPSRLWRQSLNNGERRPLGETLDISIEAASWSSQDQKVSILYDERGQRKLAELNLKGKLKVLTDAVGGTTLGRPYLSGQFDYQSGTHAVTFAGPDRPADLAIIQAGKLRQVTHLNEDLLGSKSLGAVQEVTYASDFDGTEIHGFYLTPPDFDPNQQYPMILEVHGGPHLAYGKFFSAEMQLMAASGYIVFFDNYRGSTSYGEAFARLLQGKYASREDFRDHMSGVDHMINKGFVDPQNLFVSGGSAGGIAAAYAIGLTDRFNAAVAAKPVINWISKTLTADSYVYQINHQFSGPPWEQFAEYWQRSPLSLMANVVTPTMLLTGEEDRRTPISETEQFYQALKLKGVDAAMVRLPGSSHGIAGRPSRLLSKVGHSLAWFERYRKTGHVDKKSLGLRETPSSEVTTAPVQEPPDALSGDDTAEDDFRDIEATSRGAEGAGELSRGF
jgi:dipeptidyl aminopeptidase/acylaminoacyl peptidase